MSLQQNAMVSDDSQESSKCVEDNNNTQKSPEADISNKILEEEETQIETQLEVQNNSKTQNTHDQCEEVVCQSHFEMINKQDDCEEEEYEEADSNQNDDESLEDYDSNYQDCSDSMDND